MKTYHVLTLIGGISRNSLNQSYFNAIKELNLPDFEFVNFDLSRLPYYSQDLENDPPDRVTEFKDKIREADAVLIITPEYNRSFPGVLKNAIDWGSRPYGMNLWDKKPVAVTGASPGNIGTFGAQHHLRQVLAYLNMHVLGQPEVYFKASDSFDESGQFKSETAATLLRSFFDAFKEHIALVTGQDDFRPADKAQGLQDSQVAH